jgi:hypothetical protein
MPCGNWLRLGLFGDNRTAQRHAFITNTHRPWPGDQALYFLLTATTE